MINPDPTTNSLLSIKNSKTERTSPSSIIWIPIIRKKFLFIGLFCLKRKEKEVV